MIEVWCTRTGNLFSFYETHQQMEEDLAAFFKRWPKERRGDYAVIICSDETTDTQTGRPE